MSNEPPKLEDYEEAEDVEIDLSETPMTKADINENLKEIFNGGSNE